MKIRILYDFAGAEEAEGLTVIVDIFRAATLATFLINQNIEKIFPVATVKEAILQKRPKSLLFGEEKGVKIEDFDFGNSPFEIKEIDFKGITAIHRTERGTNGIVLAKQASEVVFGSFVAASSIADYIKEQKPKTVSIVAMDGAGSEDDIFAQFLSNLLDDKVIFTKDSLRDVLRTHYSAERFLNPQKPEFPEEDFYLCTDIDRFKFFPVLKGHYLYSNGRSRIN